MYYSCHPTDDHHVVGDNNHDVEYGDHPQPLFGWTHHATVWSALLVARSDFSVSSWSVVGSLCRWHCCPRRFRTWRSGRMVGLNSCPASAVSCFTSRNFRNVAWKSARDSIGPASPWLIKFILHKFSLARYGWSCCASSSKCLQFSSVHPMFIRELRQISHVCQRWRIDSDPLLCAFLLQSFAL